MGFWFYYDVFVHELGHHHRFQYPSKTGRPRRRLNYRAALDAGRAIRFICRHWPGASERGSLGEQRHERGLFVYVLPPTFPNVSTEPSFHIGHACA